MHMQSEERAVTLGTYILEHQTTVRATAKHFGISKSTVHMDVPKGTKNSPTFPENFLQSRLIVSLSLNALSKILISTDVTFPSDLAVFNA